MKTEWKQVSTTMSTNMNILSRNKNNKKEFTMKKGDKIESKRFWER